MNRIVRRADEAFLADAAATAAPNANDPLARFAQGELSRRDAMRALGIGYGELLDRLALRGLPLPELPAAEIERMADDVVRLLDQAR